MPIGRIANRTKLFAFREQALNCASTSELWEFLTALRQGRPLSEILKAGWQARGVFTPSRAEQKHLLNDVLGLGGGGYWSAEVDAIASETFAQVLTLMLYEPLAGDQALRNRAPRKAFKFSRAQRQLGLQPRLWPKPVTVTWHSPGTYFFHAVIAETEHAISLTWITPPTADRVPEYKLYKTTEQAAEKLQRPFDRSLSVPDNLTRVENIWVVCAERWALTHGVNSAGKRTPCAIIEPVLSRQAAVSVTRSLCEEYEDRLLQPKAVRKRRA